MLEYAVDRESEYKKKETQWKIIGYQTTKTDDIMYESDGVYTELMAQKDEKLLVRTNPVLHGMSGGPWLLKDQVGKFAIANGNQSASNPSSAYTPYYSKALVEDDIIARL